MRLDARLGNVGWTCFDVKRMCRPGSVVWVDDQSAQWGRYIMPPVFGIDGNLVTESVQEEKITIYPSRRLVLFNEVDDDGEQGSEESLVRMVAPA